MKEPVLYANLGVSFKFRVFLPQSSDDLTKYSKYDIVRQALYYIKRGAASNRTCISLADSYPLDTLRAGLQSQTCAY